MNTQNIELEHKDLARGRWAKMAFAKQMANVGSEVERALNWNNKNNIEYRDKALFRAIELLNLTIASTIPFSRIKELARMKEVLLDFFLGDNLFMTTEDCLRKYFFAFACVKEQKL